MISRRALVSALNARKVADWVVVERAQDLASISEERATRRTEIRMRWSVLVHHDMPRGRGTARIELTTRQAEAKEVVDQAISLASAAIGPPWVSTPSAAPAKVTVIDPALERADLDAVAAEISATAKRPAGTTVQLGIALLRERITVQAASGFQASWFASEVKKRSSFFKSCCCRPSTPLNSVPSGIFALASMAGSSLPMRPL